MADRSGSGTTNSTTAVDIVAAPAASTTRMVPAKGINVYNADTATAAGKIQLVDGAATIVLEAFSIAAGGNFQNSGFYSLDATNKKLQVVLDAAITTNQLDWVSKWRDEAQ